jgi:hypothetical protein
MIKDHPYFEGLDFETLSEQKLKCPPLDFVFKPITRMSTYTSEKSSRSGTLVINHQTPEEIEHESKILQIQDHFKSQVQKHGFLMKRYGLLIWTYKLYEVYML